MLLIGKTFVAVVGGFPNIYTAILSLEAGFQEGSYKEKLLRNEMPHYSFPKSFQLFADDLHHQQKLICT